MAFSSNLRVLVTGAAGFMKKLKAGRQGRINPMHTLVTSDTSAITKIRTWNVEPRT